MKSIVEDGPTLNPSLWRSLVVDSSLDGADHQWLTSFRDVNPKLMREGLIPNHFRSALWSPLVKMKLNVGCKNSILVAYIGGTMEILVFSMAPNDMVSEV